MDIFMMPNTISAPSPLLLKAIAAAAVLFGVF